MIGVVPAPPAGKPKLKINTRYAKPAQTAPDKGGEQPNAAVDTV